MNKSCNSSKQQPQPPPIWEALVVIPLLLAALLLVWTLVEEWLGHLLADPWLLLHLLRG
jgi:hypothetical protein